MLLCSLLPSSSFFLRKSEFNSVFSLSLSLSSFCMCSMRAIALSFRREKIQRPIRRNNIHPTSGLDDGETARSSQCGRVTFTPN